MRENISVRTVDFCQNQGLEGNRGLEFGFRFQKKYAVSIMLDHISNASIDDQNEGLDTFGVRYGVSF